MPELPEVETVARQLDPLIRGRKLRSVEVLDTKLEGPDWSVVRGYTVSGARRVGKRVVLDLVGGGRKPPRWIAVHLRMTGRLLWNDVGQPSVPVIPVGQVSVPPTPPPLSAALPESQPVTPRPPRLTFHLAGGELRFHDTRRFGTVELLDAEPQLTGRALEPLSRGFTVKALGELLDGARGEIKPWLLRQDRIAGLGNIYASEALHQARIHPRRSAGSVSPAEVAALRAAIVDVLRRSIKLNGTTFSDFQDAGGKQGRFRARLCVYGKAGQPCPTCGTPIEQVTQQQRSTFFCPTCQPA